MTISKTLRAFAVGSLLLIGAGNLRSANAWFSATYLDTSTVVNVSSTPTSPSTLLLGTGGPSASVDIWCHQFANAGESIVVNSATTGISTNTTSGTAGINCAATNAASEHLILDDYAGAVYAVTRSSYPIPVQVIRKR